MTCCQARIWFVPKKIYYDQLQMLIHKVFTMFNLKKKRQNQLILQNVYKTIFEGIINRPITGSITTANWQFNNRCMNKYTNRNISFS